MVDGLMRRSEMHPGWVSLVRPLLRVKLPMFSALFLVEAPLVSQHGAWRNELWPRWVLASGRGPCNVLHVKTCIAKKVKERVASSCS